MSRNLISLLGFGLLIELMSATLLDMFEDLHEAIATLEVPAHADAIVLVRRLRDQLDARLAEAEATYASEHAYEPDGFGSMAAFLRQRGGMASGDARRSAKRADRLGRLDDVLSSWQNGALSGAQVDVVVAEVPDHHVERFAVTATETCSILAPLNLSDTKQALQHWVAFADSCAEREAAEAGTEAPAAASAGARSSSPAPRATSPC